MRKLILSWMIAALTLSAAGARRMSVNELSEALGAADMTHRSDLDMARQLGELEMTERLTERTLDQLAATHKIGPRTALALQLLADRSAFLDPPRNELPATELPDADAQQRMLAAAQAYSDETWARMPNFFVTRETHRFDDGPHVLAQGEWPVRAGLQPVGTSSRQVSFRDGKEVQELISENGSATGNASQELGLHSWGEFGPELTVVLADMAKHKVDFSHWEQIGKRFAAVFRFEVPREASHYTVSYCCTFDQKVLGRTQFGYGGRDRSPQQVANIPRASESHTYSETPGYHGTLAIDPTDGAVLRITIQAELSKGDPLLRAETMVEYGPVSIGDRQFICPVRSLALSMEQAWLSGSGNSKSSGANSGDTNSAWQTVSSSGGYTPILLVNETTFVNYHRLGTTTRILMDAAATGAPGPQSTDTPAASSPANPLPPVPSPEPGSGGSTPQPQNSSAVAASAETVAPATPPPPGAPVIPEVSMSAATGVPDQPADASETKDGSYSLKVTTRLVDVGLVAYDKKGHPVTDLKPGDLEIYDNGHKQEVRSFSLAANPGRIPAATTASATSTPSSAPDTQESLFANRASDGPDAASAVPASEIGSTILVIDESHIAWNDMSYARGEILKFLGSLDPGERVGLYTMTGLGFRILAEVTTDHPALIARMQKFMPSAQSAAQAQEEETRNRQHFDEVHNVADLNSVNGNHADVPDSDQPVDPQLLTMGDNPARSSFIVLAQVARHVSAIPGHKKLVWIASDNVLADWQDQSVGIDKSPKDVLAYAMRAQETLNEAHAAIYPFDVSQLEVGGVGADLQHSSVQLAPAVAENAATAASAGGPSNPTAASNRDTAPGRITAAASQDLHPVQGPVRQVADATGGRVLRRSGDLSAQLNGIVADGHATYMLSFSPQGPADGQYHTINIKLNGRRGLTLSYRTGYLFEKEPATLHDRFQQAVWRANDVSEIAVSANVSQQEAGANVKLSIAASDLGLRQQAGRWMDKLDIFFIRRDDAGVHAHVQGQTLGLKLKSSTYEKLMPAGIPFEHFVGTKPAMASLRVLVVDENSGRMGSVTIPASALGADQ